MSNKRKQGDEQTDLQKYTEREYKALKKEKNVQLKLAVEDDCDRGRDRTAELKDTDLDVTISIAGKNIAIDRAIFSASSKMPNKRKQIEDDDQADSLKYTEREYKSLKKENVQPRPIASLPPVARVHDPCLIALFKQLPPADQLTARKVCRRWADLVTYAARSTRSLAILVGDYSMNWFSKSVNYYSLDTIDVVSLLKKEDGSPMFTQTRFSQWNALLFRGGLDEATVEEIGATFLNLNTLQLGLLDVPSSQIDTFSRLLEVLAHHHQLTTLKLRESPEPPENHPPDRLFTAINGISTLKHLQLHLSTLPYHELPIISQLEQLQVYWDGCSPQQFAALLRQHATANTSLRNIEYLSYDADSDIQHFTPLGDHILSRFTRFGFPRSQFTNSQLISTHFRHLTNLYIHPTDITIHRLFNHLSQLTQLLYLHLEINFSLLLPDDQPHLLLSQLKSVKALELRLTILSHFNLEQLKIGWTMPNLQAIDLCHIWRSKCTDCTIEEFSLDRIEANLAAFKHCYRQILAPLKAKCTKLRTILYDCDNFFGSAEELLAD